MRKRWSQGYVPKEVRVQALGPDRIRAVTHLDISMDAIEEACTALKLAATDSAAGITEKVGQV